jgi:hypothetical protein
MGAVRRSEIFEIDSDGDVLSKLFRSIRSFVIGEIMPLLFCLARTSKLGGNRSRGLTKV